MLTSDEASDRALYIAQLRFDEGENELIDVLNIQQRVFGTRSSLVAIQRAVLTHYIDLSLALGRRLAFVRKRDDRERLLATYWSVAILEHGSESDQAG